MNTKILTLKEQLSRAVTAYHRCQTETGKLHYENVIAGISGEIKSIEVCNV